MNKLKALRQELAKQGVTVKATTTSTVHIDSTIREFQDTSNGGQFIIDIRDEEETVTLVNRLTKDVDEYKYLDGTVIEDGDHKYIVKAIGERVVKTVDLFNGYNCPTIATKVTSKDIVTQVLITEDGERYPKSMRVTFRLTKDFYDAYKDDIIKESDSNVQRKVNNLTPKAVKF